MRIGDALARDSEGLPCVPPVVSPRPIDGLVTKRVLVMDYLRGVPLSRAVLATLLVSSSNMFASPQLLASPLITASPHLRDALPILYPIQVEAMRERGIDPDSAEAQLFGRTMLRALTDAFGRTILGTGFFHADPQ